MRFAKQQRQMGNHHEDRTSASQIELEIPPDIPAAVYQVPTGNVWVCEFISPLASAVTWKGTPAAVSVAAVCMSHSVEPQRATTSAMNKHKVPATQNAVCRSGLRSLSAAVCYILSRLF